MVKPHFCAHQPAGNTRNCKVKPVQAWAHRQNFSAPPTAPTQPTHPSVSHQQDPNSRLTPFLAALFCQAKTSLPHLLWMHKVRPLVQQQNNSHVLTSCVLSCALIFSWNLRFSRLNTSSACKASMSRRRRTSCRQAETTWMRKIIFVSTWGYDTNNSGGAN